jgi:hypothetical protein
MSEPTKMGKPFEPDDQARDGKSRDWRAGGIEILVWGGLDRPGCVKLLNPFAYSPFRESPNHNWSCVMT